MMSKLVFVAFLGLAITTALSAELQAGGDYAIIKSTIDNGGGVSTGGSFVLSGTIGQPFATVEDAANGDYAVSGGFWARIAEVVELIFKDGFE